MKTAEEMLDDYLLDMPLFGYVKTGDAVEAMEAYHAQFTPSAKSVEVEEAVKIERLIAKYEERIMVIQSGFLIDNSNCELLALEAVIDDLKEFGANWQQQKQAENISRLREALKTIYSLAKPGSAIYDICDKTLNQKK